jgi:hypothetical protein
MKTTRPKAKSIILNGHSLYREGHPAGFSLGYTGIGKGKCSCGALSEDLPSNAARQRWHRQHKEEIIASGKAGQRDGTAESRS